MTARDAGGAMKNGWTERIEELEAEVAKLTAERDADRRREYGYSQQTVDALTVERDKLEEENAALKEYRTAEARRRAELYAAKVDANWCLKNEIEAVRKELAEARRSLSEIHDETRWAIQTEIGRQHGCNVSVMDNLHTILQKAALANKEGEDGNS